MQATHLTIDQAADVLAESKSITSMDWEGMRLHVVICGTGRESLLLQNNLSGGAFLIDGCAHDADSGGSIHYHARATSADEPAAV